MPDVGEIRLYAKQLEKHYNNLTGLQNKWLLYYDDRFKTNIKAPYHEVRTGSGARIVDTLANHIATANIQLTREPLRKGEKAKESASKIIRFLTRLVDLEKDAIDDAVHNAPLYGEAFLQPQYNYNSPEIPISITSPNPLNVLPDPQETHGIPMKFVKRCEMTVGAVKSLYPSWNPSKAKQTTDKVKYLAYFDNGYRYIEADGIPCVGGGIHINPYGFPPLVHFASGFGKSSPEATPEDRYVSVLHKVMSKLLAECNEESRIDSAIALWTNPVLVLKPTIEGAEEPQEGEIELSPGATVTLGYGWDYEVRQGEPPRPEVFHHLAQLKADIGLEIPPVMLGVPSGSGTSGRQEDIYALHFKKRPNKVKKNAERAVATCLGMILRILDTIPGALPITIQTVQEVDGKEIRRQDVITKEDIDGYYDVSVEFKPDEEIEQARKLMTYRALFDSPQGQLVTHETLLMEGLGWSQERAREEIENVYVERAMKSNPVLANIAVEEAMQELGLQKYLQQAQASGMPLMTTGLNPQVGQQGRNFQGNAQSRDSVRQMFGEAGGDRRPPAETGG